MLAAMVSAAILFGEDPALLTVAESSSYTATSTSEQVTDLIDRMKSGSAVLRVTELGRTLEDRTIPLMILANPPVSSVAEARAASAARAAPICFVMANIHAGEVEGKEACLILARELALNPDHALLKDLIIILAPNYNADGNDRFDAVEKNRPGQVGPIQCGIRPNAQGLDLNRDYIKLEAPESRALVKFLAECDPHLSIDCHTTNGSYHRYVLTYEATLNPSGHPAPIHFVREELLPEVTKRIKARTGYEMWHYGNFNTEHTVWETYSAQPRFGGPYQGLRNQMSILSEAYSYASYKDRVIATTEFIREILQYAAENKHKILEINRQAREETAARGGHPQPSAVVGIRHRVASFNEPAVVKGFEGTAGKGGEGGAAIVAHDNLGAPKDYFVVHRGRFEPTQSVSRPFAYILPPLPGMEAIIEKLRQHGIVVDQIEGSAHCEQYTVEAIHRAEREFQGHREITLDVEAGHEDCRLRDGSHIVRTDQPLGTLAVYLLEPQSEDGLATWNFFDSWLEVGKVFPVYRVRSSEDISPD